MNALDHLRKDRYGGSCLESTRKLAKDGTESDTPGLILASNSPRRQAILEQAGYEFDVVLPSIDESAVFRRSLAENQEQAIEVRIALGTRSVAEAKAVDVFLRQGDTPITILAADTVVYFDGRILGKPTDEAEALQMLKALSGRSHQVITAVALVRNSQIESFVSIARVNFHPWDSFQEKAALTSIQRGSAMDKAGAYGIQDGGAMLVESIEGDYYTVVGLPISLLYRRLSP